MARFSNYDIRLLLSDLRSKIRNGAVTVNYKTIGGSALADTVASRFGVLGFDKANFNPQTVKRFAMLFEVPHYDEGGVRHWPTQDDTATALQNFINRRSDPWAHVTVGVSDETDAPQFVDASV